MPASESKAVRRHQAKSPEAPDAGRQQREANAQKLREDVRALGWAAIGLAMHLEDCWPARGRRKPPAGEPTFVTATVAQARLADLGKALAGFLPPEDATARQAWCKAKRVALTPDVSDAVSKITSAYLRFDREFGFGTPYCLARGFLTSGCLIPSIHSSRPWPPAGRPVPEFDGQETEALTWNAVVLLRASGWGPAGQAQAPAPEAAYVQSLRPRWDGETRTLHLGVIGIKTYGRQPAERQIDLLEAFERAGWPHSVADPFNHRETLNQTCKDLNKGLPVSTIQFHPDGSGEGVCWALAAPAKLPPGSP